MVAGTLLSQSKRPHWIFRVWDFPRVQIATLATVSGALYGTLFFQRRGWEWLFLGGTALSVARQGYKVWPYTRLAPVHVQQSDRPARGRGTDSTFTLLVCNVLMENRDHDRFLRVVRENDPDVVLVLEADQAWRDSLAVLRRHYPHAVEHPQGNYYGMLLFSRLELRDPEVRFLVQDDIPSIRAVLKLRDGTGVHLYGLHPRPPEPVRDQSSAPRDAELVVVGREIDEAESRPTVVAGDLNDVAWSSTSELFLRVSGLLDPRVGRGFYNSYNANNALMRFPLDHVFHSNHFKLVELRRLEHVGSDHFPLMIELSYEPEAEREQPETAEEPGDEQEAREKLAEQAEAAAMGEDRPGRE